MSLILGRGSTAHRNELGPLAWTVLEEMALDAEPSSDGRLRTGLGARQVAERLGINKDTANKALRRLVEAGMLQREAARGTHSGRFAAGGYVVVLPSGMTVSDRAGLGRRRTRRPMESGTQLSLLAVQPASHG